MKIGIIGAANTGSALAGHFQRLGHSVLIASPRGPDTLSQVAQKKGATPVAVSEASRRGRPAGYLDPHEAGLQCCIWVSRLCWLSVAPQPQQIEPSSPSE